MADQEHIEFQVASSGYLTDFDSEAAFLQELVRKEDNGWKVIGFAYGPDNCYRALLRREAG